MKMIVENGQRFVTLNLEPTELELPLNLFMDRYVYPAFAAFIQSDKALFLSKAPITISFTE